MTDTGPSPFEISGKGWSISFQRRVTDPGGKDRSPNRGALPCQVLESRPAELSVIVPLPEGEEIWIAAMLEPDFTLRGTTVDGDALVVTELSAVAGGDRLLGLDAVSAQGGIRAIDRNSVSVAGAPADLARQSLMIELAGAGERESMCLHVILATPELYAATTGRSPPAASLPEHSFAGWRLP
ncbi:hypothetical protein SAMN05444161_5897 [Rhizobiales bacterium GAS191]|nr:hypothetical protein SAMN05444161_5897 [Rhizobiales bacterium GAS191]